MREMGFEELFKIRPSNLPYGLLSFLLDRFDPKEKCLKVHGTCMRIIEGDAHCILGLPKGRINIKKLVRKGIQDVELERKLKITVGTYKMIEMPTLKKSLIGIKIDELEFRVTFVLYIID